MIGVNFKFNFVITIKSKNHGDTEKTEEHRDKKMFSRFL